MTLLEQKKRKKLTGLRAILATWEDRACWKHNAPLPESAQTIADLGRRIAKLERELEDE